MIIFISKSAICLVIFYGFYCLFLRNIKAFGFNRFYLLISLLFAVAIPFVTIPVGMDLPSNIERLSNVAGRLVQREKSDTGQVYYLAFQNVLAILYLSLSSFLFLRFAVNIYKIVRLIRTCPTVDNISTQIVLVEKETLPHSFFRYIFVNRLDYENGKIEKELIIHEQVHCKQYHSFDILFIEMVKIILWFNPMIWVFRNAIQLNHEFLADDKVLSSHDLKDYQNTLLNLSFRNNSIYLASNLSYSLTKKRLIMMTKKSLNDRVVLRKIAVIPLFFILAITLAFVQERSEKEQNGAVENHEVFTKEQLANEQKAVVDEQSASFQAGLVKERKAAAEEQKASFQAGLAKEQKAVAEEQKLFTQEQLTNEQKAAADGTIVIGQKEK